MSGLSLSGGAPARPGAGWIGKLPSRGDFVGGGAQGELIEALRSWAERGLVAVRAGGGPARDAFLTAPLWRFACRPGWAAARGGVGVMAPGMDAAGRLFPVIVACESAAAAPQALLARRRDWLAEVEDAILLALPAAGAAGALDAAMVRATDGPAAADEAPCENGEQARFESDGPPPRALPADAPDEGLFRRLFGPAEALAGAAR